MKICTNCKIEKENIEYNKQRNGKYGVAASCRQCRTLYSKEYREGKGKELRHIYGKEYNKRYRTVEGNKEKRKYNREWYKKLQQRRDSVIYWIKTKYEGLPCMDCKRVFPWCAMDFDHRPEETKEFGIAMMSSYKATPDRISKVMKEISKCDLVCASCHRIRTHLSRR